MGKVKVGYKSLSDLQEREPFVRFSGVAFCILMSPFVLDGPTRDGEKAHFAFDLPGVLCRVKSLVFSGRVFVAARPI